MGLDIQTLRKFHIFSLFKDDGQLGEFLQAGKWSKRATGEFVYQAGEPAFSIFVLARGKVRISKNKKVLAALEAGAVFGEIAPLVRCDRTTTAQALGDIVLFEFNVAAMDRLPIEIRYEMLRYLYETTAGRFLEATRKAVAGG